jgi:hypothetical protein
MQYYPNRGMQYYPNRDFVAVARDVGLISPSSDVFVGTILRRSPSSDV